MQAANAQDAASPSAPDARPPEGIRGLPLWAAALAIGWFGFWGLVLRPEPVRETERTPPPAPRVTYLPGTEGLGGRSAQADLRALWSPVLFALPTPMGFSRGATNSDVAWRPPLQQTQSEPVLLTRPPPAPAALMAVTPGLLARRAAAPPALVPAEPPVFAGAPAATGRVWQVVLGDGLAGIRWQQQPLPEAPAEDGESLWEAGAQLEISREGVVQHVWLDTPTASAQVNDLLLHALLGWRSVPEAKARSGRVVLRCLRRPALRSSGGGSGP